MAEPTTTATVYEPIARMYKGFYDALISVGFDDVQALHIVRNIHIVELEVVNADTD